MVSKAKRYISSINLILLQSNSLNIAHVATYLDSGLPSLDSLFSLLLLNLRLLLSLLLRHNFAVSIWIALGKLLELHLPVKCVGFTHLFLLLLVELLVGLAHMVLPEVKQQAKFLAASVQVDSHAPIVFSSKKISQAWNILGWAAQSCCRIIDFCRLSATGSGGHWRTASTCRVSSMVFARAIDERLLARVVNVTLVQIRGASEATLGLRRLVGCIRSEIVRLAALRSHARQAVERISSGVGRATYATSEALTRGCWGCCMLKIRCLEISSPHVCVDIVLSCGAGERIVHCSIEVLIKNRVARAGGATSHEVTLSRTDIDDSSSWSHIGTGARHLAH